ncbi:ABC transporter permease [Anaeroselena agilis]|uniref:Iron ABC transporter permease n=1 Tax=Anaeroselena agilis TaxID=3063788 RepID=A0ABU3NXW3_9FIRM|nr:iron ABC transporter permease [Selenomonadales bacterium 4137-cl]
MINRLRQKFDAKWVAITAAVAVLVLFIVFPMLYLIWRSIFVEGSFDFATYRHVYSQSANWRAFLNTFYISLSVTLASVCISFPLAWLVGRTDLPGKGFFRTTFIASYMIPPYVGAIAWTQLLNPSVGYLNDWLVSVFKLSKAPFDIYGMGGLIWCLTLFYSPFAFITISRALEKMDPSLEEASRVAGASPLGTLWRVTLPLMFPSIIAGGVLVFIGVGSAFGIPAIIGMPAQIEVLTTRIVTYVYLGTGKGIRDATALAVSLMIAANFVLYASTWILTRKDYVTISGKSTRPNLVELGKWKWPLTLLVSLYGFIAIFLPLASIAVTSLIKSLSRPISLDNLTIATWLAALKNDQYMTPLWTSFVTGAAAATIATVIALFTAYLLVKTKMRGRAIPDALATLGGATPSIVIALALIITFSGEFGLNLYNTFAILVVAYMVKYITMAVRTIAASLSQVHSSLEEAALNSGATWLQSLRDIMLPLIGPSIVAGWFLVFMPSFYELTMSIILYGSQTKTIGVLLYELQTYADPQDASVLAVIILLIILVGNLILRKVSKGAIGI